MPETRGPGGVRATPGWLPLYGGFLITGVVTVLLGPLLPDLAREWRLPVEELRALFVVQFLASAVGSFLSSYRLGLSLGLGYLLIAAGLVSLSLAGWPMALAPMAAVGFGLGLAIPATNLGVAHAQPQRRGAALSSLNMVWGAGAVACPLLFAVRPAGMSSDAVLLVLAGAAGLVLTCLAWNARPAAAGRFTLGAPASSPASEENAPQGGGQGGVLRGLVVIAAIMFLYVGIENSVGGWLVSLADQFQAGRSATSLWIGSGFWAALLASRAAAPLVLRRMSEPTLYTAGVVLAGGGLLGLLLSGSQAGLAVAAVAAGAGLAPLFPLTISFLADLTAATRSRNTGWVFALAGAGGAVLPWLTGRLAGGADGLAAGFVAPIGGLVLLALLFGLLRRLSAPVQPQTA
ncbi:MAG: hypothetical protein F4210_05520 [Holophagales bacterium]|nr:hypothetical protein [Holophagales bacterium]MYF94960.1 hypothetical protein [Holophagales bacterium]